MLREYEKAKAHFVKFQFRDAEEAAQFRSIADDQDGITILRQMGRTEEAKRVILNTVCIRLASDCMHHIYEALGCMERRKVIVAFNLLRKPLTDNLVFLAWMLGNEDEFFHEFTLKSPEALTSKLIGNRREVIIESALSKTRLIGLLDASWINSTIFQAGNKRGLYVIFQKAVHLITVVRTEAKTERENFNFIFKNPADDDSYIGLYEVLPTILLFLTHVTAELFNRMHEMDRGSKLAFQARTVLGFHVVANTNEVPRIKNQLLPIAERLKCATCKTTVNLTRHNMSRILLSESFRCTKCHRVNPFPFAWLF